MTDNSLFLPIVSEDSNQTELDMRRNINFLSSVLGKDIVLKLLGIEEELIEPLLVEYAKNFSLILNFRVILSVRNYVDLGLKLMNVDELRKWFILPTEDLGNISPLEFIIKQKPFLESDWRPAIERALSAAL